MKILKNSEKFHELFRKVSRCEKLITVRVRMNSTWKPAFPSRNLKRTIRLQVSVERVAADCEYLDCEYLDCERIQFGSLLLV